MPRLLLPVLALLAFFVVSPVMAQRGPGRGFGRGPGGPGHGHDERHEADHDLFHFLLTNHEQITRTVKNLDDGVETLTESEDPEIAEKIQEHVKWMEWRVEKTKPIRMRDPLFAELFKHTDKIKMQREETRKGIRVTETSSDPDVARLIQAHAEVVSKFVERGFAEAMKNHAVPGADGLANAEFHNPTIAPYGKVVRLPDAAQQPREGSKIVVDVTRGGDPRELNAAIEKVARFVNIYAGAGKKSADVQIALVLHGDATLCVLNADAYSAEFDTQGNPNLDCLHELHEAGVEIFVCGQSLIGKSHRPGDVAVFVDVAVSALTALVNHQSDGFAYVPLLK